MDHLQRLVIAGGGGELFKPCLGDERNLDVGPCGELEKSVAQPCVKTMQGAGCCFLPTHHRSLIGGVQADGQHPRTSVAVKHQVLIGLDRKHRQLL